MDFRLVVNHIKEVGTSKLTTTQLAWATYIIEGMNSTRHNYNYSIIPKAIIEPYWLVGFIEGEGTFGIKTLTPFFQVAQHDRNKMILTAISDYLEALPKAFTYSTNTLPPRVSWTLNKPVSVWSLSISNVDALHDYVIYLF